MAIPTNKQEFGQWCLRKIGKPLNTINLSEGQLDDRIDEALAWFAEYHFEGTEKVYYKKVLTTQDIANKYITLPDNIIGAVSIFDIGDSLATNNIFNIRYQIALNDLYTLTNVSMVPYYMAMQHMQFIEYMLVGKQPIRYNRMDNRLYVDMDWARIGEGGMLIVEAYGVIDPAVYSKVWNNIWLKRYAVALLKENYGENLKKFSGVQMPGGVTFNGQQIYDEAVAERKEIERDVIHSYSLPVTDFIG